MVGVTVREAERLVFQIKDERGRIEFLGADREATAEWANRCVESFGE